MRDSGTGEDDIIMKIINAKVYTEDGTFQNKDVYTDGEWIAESGNEGEVLDGSGCYLIPGLTDIHFHGCAGCDFCDGNQESIETMAVYEAFQGITTIVPATMTLGKDSLEKICKAAASYPNEKGAVLCGINMEGPFISLARKGAQNGDYVHRPDAELFRELNAASGGLVKLLAIAPEEPGVMDCLRTAVLEMGIPLESAVKCAAVNPARSVGIYDSYGSITPGKTANMVLLKEEDLSTVQAILKGKAIR